MLLVIFAACSKQKKTTIITEQNATLQLNISHVVGARPLSLSGVSYQNEVGEAYTISAFKYYIGNVTLYYPDEKSVTVADTYFLVSEDSAASKKIIINGLPAGNFSRLSFRIGVDSARNNSGAQSGALDPVYGMFWTWNSGYIMAKVEGNSPVSMQPDHQLQFHIGGYVGAQNVVRTVMLDVPGLVLRSNEANGVSLVADVSKWFSGPDPVSFKTLSSWMTPGPVSVMMADKYKRMFSVVKVGNQ
ncbi:hypothetical protein CK934_11990 [Chitinophaga sp. MD30]|nr:hypothetical protein CK934_11990 [Chitinophaga sp. MD30]